MPIRPCLALVAVGAAVALSVASEPGTESAVNPPDFGRQVRPILSDHCFACHGPDEAKRQADLRLDTAEGLASLLANDDGESSELIARIDSTDPDTIMPPPEFQKPLSEEQRRLLRQWIESGAEVEQHWAFVPPTRSWQPSAGESDASLVDHFIDARLQSVGLPANSRADRAELLRRVCLDLTGLPPSREQIESFLQDSSPDAYGRLVDQLLESPNFGEHFGRYWLDLVRYADTHGLHLDNYREMWPYRDWVIGAFNANLPFDQFLTHQLAGDLLPEVSDKERIASGFNRLNVTTNEGGSIYDEVFVRNVTDRTDAFGTIFLGMTTGCAVCHDHKFDPISTRDYYSLYAFFNSLDGQEMDGNIKDPSPVIPVPTEEQKIQMADFDRSIESVKAQMLSPIDSVDAAQLAWEHSLVGGVESRSEILIPVEVVSQSAVPMRTLEDGSVELSGEAAAKDTLTIVANLPRGTQWQTLRLEALVDAPEQRAGVSENGNAVLSEITIETPDTMTPGQWIRVPIVHAFADIEQADGPFAIGYAIDSKVDEAEGWAIAGHQQTGGRNAWLVMSPLVADADDAKIRVTLQYQSQFAKHQFRRVRLSLGDAMPKVPAEQRIQLGEVHVAGPFPLENSDTGYDRKIASQQDEFRADEVFTHENRPYRWQHRGDLLQVNVNPLPSLNGRSSVVVLHQDIVAPSEQKATLLVGNDDGHVIYLNGKEIGTRKGPHELNPLNNEYSLDLKKGRNDLYFKIVNHDGPSQLTFAFRSPALEVPAELIGLVSIPSKERSAEKNAAIQKYYRKVICLHPDWLALLTQEKGLLKAKEDLQANVATTLVWKELAQPRQAHVLTRGQYDQPADTVDRNTPAFLPPFPADAPRDRLGLARWLLSPEHPLTARVAVNRVWQQIFGTGLVRTGEDFGSQGEPPSHPELLDTLAVDFRESGWDIKRLVRILVMSDAYCRSAEVSDSMQQVDPANRLLARGPRHRLDAEVLRDQTLFLSGLLVDRQGGPSVKLPQPEGLWEAVGYSSSNTARFVPDEGEKVFRRSVYTFWKRTSPPPQMTTFDAPSRESCMARRERTNTPLQALTMMNEPQNVQAAKQLARRSEDVLRSANVPGAENVSGAETAKERAEWLFQTVTARLPDDREAAALLSLLQDTTVYYQQNPELALQLIGTSDAEQAAWTIVASTLLNLDEAISK